jgi:hypothetical protein
VVAAIREGKEFCQIQKTQFDLGHEGKYTKQLDRALPGPYTRRLYNGLNREEAQIVVQLRTNKSRLNSALYKIKAADTEQCEQCQRPEPVRHFLVECPR